MCRHGLLRRERPRGWSAFTSAARRGVQRIADQLPAKSEQERAAHARLATFKTDGFGYFLEQSTRPQTIGYSLQFTPSDSRPGCSTITTTTTRLPARSSTASPAAISTRDQHRRQHHPVLADGHRRPGPPWYWEWDSAWLSRAAGSVLLRRQGSGRLSRCSRERSRRPAQLGRDGLPRPRLLQRGRARRPLRGMGSRLLFASELRAAFKSLR